MTTLLAAHCPIRGSKQGNIPGRILRWRESTTQNDVHQNMAETVRQQLL